MLKSGQINDSCFFLQENETAIEFAARVKADICKKGGLVDLPWLVSIWKGGCTKHVLPY